MNAEERKAYYQKWVADHREERNAYLREWRKNNPEKVKAQRERAVLKMAARIMEEQEGKGNEG